MTRDRSRHGGKMGSITDALKARKEKVKQKIDAPAPSGDNGATAAAVPAPAVKVAKKKAKSKPKTEVVKETKAVKTDKPKPKAVKTAKPKAAGAKPEVVKATERVRNRDKAGDGLRDVERDVIKILARGGGEMSILNIAEKMFGKPADAIPREGVESVRVVRNALRKPEQYGILKWTSRGVIKLVKKNLEEAKTAGARYVERARSARKSAKAEASATKAAKAAKPKTAKAAKKAAKPKTAKKAKAAKK